MPQIISNKIQCLSCGDIIESRHRHDFKSCSCGAVAIDGGYDYQHITGNNWKNLVVTSNDPYKVQRAAFTWKSYGKSGNEYPRYIPLKDLDTPHIFAILDTQIHIKGTWVEKLLNKEILHRQLNGNFHD